MIKPEDHYLGYTEPARYKQGRRIHWGRRSAQERSMRCQAASSEMSCSSTPVDAAQAITISRSSPV